MSLPGSFSEMSSPADLGILHLRLDNFLQLADELECPITDAQRHELGRLHTYIDAVDTKRNPEVPTACQYREYLQDSARTHQNCTQCPTH